MFNLNTTVIMNNFKKFSKLALAALVTSSLFVACSDEISENAIDTPYTANTGNIRSAGTAVDLGLPSGTLWANMNVGASSESENGLLFVWGDVTGAQMLPTTSTSYTDVTAPKTEAEMFNMFKGSEKEGYLYNTTNVYKENISPLLSDMDISDVDNIVKDIFDKVKDGKTGKLMATVINGGDIFCHCDMNLDGGGEYVRVNNPEYYDKEKDVWNVTINKEKGLDIVVDLIESTKVNYFESTDGPNNYTEIKDDMFDPDLVTRKDYAGSDFAAPAYLIVADAQHDPATANWGAGWRMPTTKQIQELIDKCTWEFEGTGYRVTGPNGNSIFLPAAGYRYGGKVYGNGNAGYYATGEIQGSYHFPSMEEQANGSQGSFGSIQNMPNVLIYQHGQFAESAKVYNNLSTSYGFSVRPVVTDLR